MAPFHLDRIAPPLAFLASLSILAACGSSATTLTSPTGVQRCGVTVTTNQSEIPSQGGSGSITVTAARECQWTAAAEGQWLSIRNGASGQGDGTVEFAVAANGDPIGRRGAVVVNGQRVEIVQAAGACEFTLSPPSSRFSPAGGSGQVDLRASSALCQWTASTEAGWITIRRSSGQGSAQIPFDVHPTDGAGRAGTIVVAGQQHSITQSEGCAYAINPAAYSAPASGGAGSIAIDTGPGCPWTASSNVPWIRFPQSEGSGPAAVAFTVEAASGPERTGSAVVAGQPFTVTQGTGCRYSVEPAALSVGAEGGTVTVQVSAPGGCAWTAATDAPWISIQGSASGSGTATVRLVVAATTGPSRTGTVTIAGRTVSISQGAGCTYSIAPTSATVPAAGGSGRIAVTTAASCAWTAASSASWLTITAGASGSGNGEIQYTAAATTGASRVATITVGGQTFTLTQGQGCTYTLSATGMQVGDAGGQGSFNVQTADGCEWTAASQVPWITLNSPASATGPGTVRFTVASNTGPARTGSITAAGQTFTVSQGTGCSSSLSPTSESMPAAGGTGTVNVTAPANCAWTAASNASWLTIISGSSGSGNGRVTYSAAPNTGAARSGTLTIAGIAFTVNQAAPCSFTISPDQTSIDAAGGTRTVNVTAGQGCAWTASSAAAWIRITAGTSGTGSGTVQIAIDRNTGPARTGTVSIAGLTFTVSQAGGCTITLNPTSRQVPANGGTRSVDVTTSAGCTWTAASQVAWITIVSGASGNGPGSVEFSVQPNSSGTPRTGTILIGGVTFTVEQQ